MLRAAHAIPPLPAWVGRRQEAAASSLTWILWRRCGRPRRAARRLPAPPAQGVRWAGRGEGFRAPCPEIQRLPPHPPPPQRRAAGEKPLGGGTGKGGVLGLGIPHPGGPSPTGIPRCRWGRVGGGGAGAACPAAGEAAGLGGGIPSPKLSLPSNLLRGWGVGGREEGRILALGPRSRRPPRHLLLQPFGCVRPRLVPHPLCPPVSPKQGQSGVAAAGATTPLPSPRPTGPFVFPNPGRRNNLLIKCINS